MSISILNIINSIELIKTFKFKLCKKKQQQ